MGNQIIFNIAGKIVSVGGGDFMAKAAQEK